MLLDKSIKELSLLLEKKEISSVDLVEESLSRIILHDKVINSFITVREKSIVLKEARKKDKERTKESNKLFGIPFSLKDAYVTKGIRTTAGSNILENFIPQYNATAYDKLLTHGAILIGKNNQDAWGHGASTENTDFGVTKNPWDTSRVSGGSSGGSAAAIASRMITFSIGEDTGGSIRNPSSICNTSGLKVTYGRVSRYGAIAYASSLDSVGPMAKSVEDLAIILKSIAGIDSKDASSSHRNVPEYATNLLNTVKGKKIGIPKEFFTKGLNAEIKEIITDALKAFEKLGVEIVDISIPFLEYGIPIYYLIAASETSSNLARYDGIRYGNARQNFTQETVRRIMLGTYALSAGYSDKLYKKAQKARTVLISEFNNAFEKCDIIVSPINPVEPTKIGELINDPLRNMLEDLYTVTVNLVGVPSLAIPAGFSKNNLPIGMQLIGKKFAEETLLQFGYQFQQTTTFHERSPKL